MYAPLKGEQIVKNVGGRFKLTALIQHRMRELMDGARPLIERQGRSDLELAIEEISQGKITIELGENTQPRKMQDAIDAD
jgi:DNA-directed RNA polymerase subunit omega